MLKASHEFRGWAITGNAIVRWLAVGAVFGSNGDGHRHPGSSHRPGVAQHTTAGEGDSIDCEQPVPGMDSIRGGFRGGKCDPVASRVDKEERRPDTLITDNIRRGIEPGRAA